MTITTILLLAILASPLQKNNDNLICREVGLQEILSRIESGSDTTYVVNFWATWCKPCVEELPSFDALRRSTKKLNVKIIMVSLDDPKQLDEKVKPFIKRLGYDLEFVLLNEAKPHLWINRVDSTWSGSIPATLLVNSGRGTRQFFETDFTKTELLKTVTTFRETRND